MPSNNTLNKDINLIERENGYWDYEFQYGDIVTSENKQSLRNGLIIACLTSWNYINKGENPTYQEFGNKSYWELNKKKSGMVEYTIKQYFIEVLNRIRRVHRIVDLQVIDHPTDPNAYNVQFTVEATNDEIVNAQFPINTQNTQITPTTISYNLTKKSTNPLKPLQITIKIENEYNDPLNDEIIHIYRVNDDGTEEHIKSCHPNISIPIYPQNSFGYDEIIIKYNGNEQFTGATSETITILNIPYIFIKQDNNLRIIKNKEYPVTAYLGTVITNPEQINLNNTDTHYLETTEIQDTYIHHQNVNGQWTTSTLQATNITQTTPETGQIRLILTDHNNTYILSGLNIQEDGHIEIAL